jgi:hypothetical protein
VKLEFNYVWFTTGKKLANILHMQPQTGLIDYASQITISNCNMWANSWMTTGPGAHLSSVLTLVSLVATDIGSEFGAQAQSDNAPQNGSGSDTALPSSVAALAQFGTSHRSRTGRGRVFLPGVPQSAIVGQGTLDPTFAGNLVDDLNAFNSALGGLLAAGFQLCVASKKDATAYQTLTIQIRSMVCASQDRRELNRS